MSRRNLDQQPAQDRHCQSTELEPVFDPKIYLDDLG